jgi:hypothetical protein
MGAGQNTAAKFYESRTRKNRGTASGRGVPVDRVETSHRRKVARAGFAAAHDDIRGWFPIFRIPIPISNSNFNFNFNSDSIPIPMTLSS